MRKLILVAALGLASCGGNQQANNAAVSEESGATQFAPTNDTTAIDAATGDAANMAADVNYTFNEQTLNEPSNSTDAAKPRASRKAAPTFEPDEPGAGSATVNNTGA
jgi:hypothetical protein